MQRLSDLSLRAKLGAGYGLVLALTATVGLVMLWQIGKVNTGGRYLGDKTLPRATTLNLVARDAIDLRRAQLKFVLDPHTQGGLKAKSDIAADEAGVAAAVSKLSKLLQNAQERALWQTTTRDWHALLTQTAPLQSLALANRTAAASALVTTSLPTYTSLIRTIDNWTALNNAWAAGKLRSNASDYSSAQTIGYLLVGLALILGAGIAVAISTSIKRRVDVVLARLHSLEEYCLTFVRKGLEALAEGDLTRRYEPVTPLIENPSADEIGQVGAAVNGIRERVIASLLAYNQTATRLGETVGTVARTAETVSATSQEMAASSEETGRSTAEIAQAVGGVAEGAERQVQMIAQARQAAEEIATATSASADSAGRAAAVSEEALKAADQGVGAAEQVDEAMRSVRDASHEVTAAIQDLAGKSERIGAIVLTITGIAEQTNLLALNAAIEAARAGEHGRGFAVVAEEVRKLAEESQEAAHEISELITAIQSGTTNAVTAVETGARRTEDGAVVVEQSRDAFVRIGGLVRDISGRIEQIAATSQQIAANAASMQESVADAAAVAEESSASTEQVSAATQETSASAEQVSASAQALASAAEDLGQMIAAFKVAGAAND
jgi:methyl-accepting chemotaxis protein